MASRDDPAIVSIVEGLAQPLTPAQMPPRPQLPPVSARLHRLHQLRGFLREPFGWKEILM